MTTMTGTYSTFCTCGTYDDDDTFTPSNTCYGYCWDEQMDDFGTITEHLLAIGTEWRIEGFPVWYGTIGGTFTARNAKELLHAITPDNTDWHMDITATDTAMTVRLSHHDGSGLMTVAPIVEA